MSYEVTKSRMLQWVGILLLLTVFAGAYWYFQVRAGVKSNTASSQPQGIGRLDSGLAGYWKLDETTGSTAADASTNSNNGTLVNMENGDWVTGQIENGLDFDGSNEQITVPGANPIDIRGSMTLSTWAKFDTLPGNGESRAIFRKAADSGANHLYTLRLTNLGAPTYHLLFTPGGGGAFNYSDAFAATTGTWYLLTLTYDAGTDVVTYYFNGVPVGTDTDTVIGGYASGTGDLYIGSTGGSEYFDGQLDEVRIYDRVLSTDEVGQLYRLTTPTSVDTSLKGYWSFNGSDISGTTAYDRSGTGNTLTLTGSPTVTGGPVGQALDFSGSNSASVTPSGAGYGYGTSDFSVSVWAKTSGYVNRGSSLNVIIGRGNEGGSTSWHGIAFPSTHKPYFSVGNGTATSGAMAINDNQWHHFTGIRRGNVVELWVDGVKTTDGSTTSNISSTSTPFYVANDGAGTRYFTGSVDEPRVYNRALSASEIKSLYDIAKPDATNSSSSQTQGTGRLDSGLVSYWKLDENTGTSTADASTNAGTGTLTNGPTWTTGQIGSGVDFDGTNDYIIATANNPALASLTKTSVSFWMKPQSSGYQGGIFRSIVSDGGGNGPFTSGFEVSGDSWSGSQTIRLAVDGSTGDMMARSTTALTLDTWVHVVVVWDGTLTAANTKFYINGALDPTVATQNGSGSYGASDGSATIGLAEKYFDGMLDEIRIYDRMLSADEVGTLYRLTSPTSIDTSLKGYWSFNGKDLSGTTAYDRSGLGSTGTLTNGTASINGIVGQALSFDGTNDYVNLGVSTPYQFANTTFTVTGWFKSSPSVNGGAFVAQGGVAGQGGWFVGLNGDTTGKLSAVLKNTDGGQTGRLSTRTGFNDSNWHQFAFVVTTNTSTYTGNSLVIYADGALQPSTANSDSTSGGYDTDTSTALLGARGSGSDAFFTGGLDEVRIYNRALTAAEIQGQYDSVKPENINSSATQAQGVGRLDSGLAGYWKFDDGTSGATPTTAVDASTNGNNGTLIGGPTWTSGPIGSAINFDGSDDRVVVAAGTGVIDAKQDVTLSAWINPQSATYRGIIYKGEPGCSEGTAKYMLELNGYFYFYMGGSSISTGPADISPTLNQWQHIVATNSAGGSAIYLNGVRVASGATLPTPSSGSQDWWLSGCNSFPGKIDEVRIYNRALSSDEVSQLYRLNAPTGTDTSLKGYWSFNGKDVSGTTAYDRSGMGNNGTLTAGATVTNGKLGQALSLDGVDDYVNITSMPSAMFSNTTFTATGWFKTASDSVYILSQDICDGGWGVNVWGGYFGALTRGNGGCGAGGVGRSSTIRVDDNKWHHFAAVITTDTVTSGNNNIIIYIDGVLNQGSLTAGVYGTAADSKVQIGTRYSGTNPFLGSIDEVRIYNRALTATEVLGLYNQSR